MTNYEYVLKNMVSFSEFNRGQAGKIFDEVKNKGTKIVIKNNRPECVLVSVNDYIQMVDEINDAKDFLMAVDRIGTFGDNLENTISQEEVEKIFDIDSSDYKEIEIE